MHTNAKINLNRYFLLTVSLLALSYLTVKSFSEYMIIVLVMAAACVNHWMLIFVVRQQSESAVNKQHKRSKFISLMVIGKLVLVAAALSFGVQIMGKRIIIPVLIYVLQIVVLYLSFEKKTSAD
jgi:hypothetical protein